MTTLYDPTHRDRVRITTCESCGHDAPHRNLAGTWLTDTDGDPVLVEHPDYDPAEWHCAMDGCACVVVSA